ncbi:MAG: integrase arm-type DNA-binding domain-containing protein, partial [Salinisphaeraceae bacterium]|nr:integrase arm-type DNA-binding domain-containing protein [Salinisphaeraceae bacterium]
MPRTTKPLTNTEVSKAKPKKSPYSLFDGDGLQLRIKPNGVKTWILDYHRPHTKARTSITFGNYPALSIADARAKRAEAKALLSREIDPKEQRDEQLLAKQAAYST